METYSQFDFELLEALGRFEYLTTKHIQRLQVSNSLHFIQSRVRRLVQQRKSPLIGVLDFGSLPTKGRLPRLLYLTQNGERLLQETETTTNPIKRPINARLFSNDYIHRINTIDALITAYKWAIDNGGEMTECVTYYGKGRQGDKGRPLAASHVAWVENTEIKNIIPDAVFKLQAPNNERLFCLEITNGDKWQVDKGKIFAYLQAFAHEAIEETFNYAHAARLLFVYEKTQAMAKLIQWTNEHPKIRNSAYKNRLFITSLEQMKVHDFNQNLTEICQ